MTEPADIDAMIAWLNVQLDDDERKTRGLLVVAQQTSLTLKEPRLLGREIPGWHAWPDVERMCVERLGELDAKRRILDEHGPNELRTWECRSCAGPHGDDPYTIPCPTVRLFALPYAARPGYRGDWCP